MEPGQHGEIAGEFFAAAVLERVGELFEGLVGDLLGLFGFHVLLLVGTRDVRSLRRDRDPGGGDKGASGAQAGSTPESPAKRSRTNDGPDPEGALLGGSGVRRA
ncbi:MAG: hypothetical protein BroJett003_01380 [Planctomycetota bacterium]|nr:MAG: hypothetical protein BroJett003_01380 [Planctomycetota bacterium]